MHFVSVELSVKHNIQCPADIPDNHWAKKDRNLFYLHDWSVTKFCTNSEIYALLVVLIQYNLWTVYYLRSFILQSAIAAMYEN